jgi:hypothetical protein
LGLKPGALGRALQLTGRDPSRYVTAWEKAAHPIPGPVAVAVGYMLAEKARQGLQEAVSQAQAILTPPDPAPPVLEASRPAVVAIRNRRRG